MATDFSIKQGDTLPVLADTLTYSDGSAANLAGATVKFIMRSSTAFNPAVNATATVTNGATGAVQYTFTSTDTATAGKYVAVWQVTFAGGNVQTFPTIGELSVSVEENIASTSSARLVGLAEIKDHLRIPASNRTFDARLTEMIDAAAPVIEGICGPILQRRVQDETYDGGNWFIELRNRPVIEVHQVVEYRGPIPYNLTQIPTPDLGSIYCYMFEAPGRIIRRTVGGGITPFPPGASQVIVTYTAGYTSVPSNVREATLELIRENFQQTEMIQRGTFGGGGGSIRDDESPMAPASGFYVTDRVREMLAPSKRPPSVA